MKGDRVGPLDRGIDFYDVAEMYPVPPTPETFGISEEIVGRWMATKPRHTMIVATNPPFAIAIKIYADTVAPPLDFLGTAAGRPDNITICA